ncbi:MAG: hypothetical protein KDN22_33340 [Verrucomicrobiae bacterium]|nr:hypothetical protein [Verrucomicrobiae bacterium]
MNAKAVYTEIDQLDRELNVRLKREFQSLAETGSSMILSWYRKRRIYTGSFWRNEETQEFQRIVDRLNRLSEKVADPSASPMLSVITDWKELHSELPHHERGRSPTHHRRRDLEG